MNWKDGFLGKLLPGNLHSIRNLFWKIEYIFLSDYRTGLPFNSPKIWFIILMEIIFSNNNCYTTLVLVSLYLVFLNCIFLPPFSDILNIGFLMKLLELKDLLVVHEVGDDVDGDGEDNGAVVLGWDTVESLEVSQLKKKYWFIIVKHICLI